MLKKTILALTLLVVPVVAFAEEWYKGGTLHNATAREWHQSTARNQLATSADFVAAAKVAANMEQLRTRATAVRKCITEATDDPDLYSQKVSEVAAACIVLLHYK